MSIPAVLMTGAIFYVSARHFVAFVRLPARREHFAFAVTCLFVALYMAATAALYNAETSSSGLFWQRVQVVIAIYVAISFLWFVSRYTGLVSAFVRNTFCLYYAASSVVLALDESGLSWGMNLPAVKEVNLPFGYRVVYHEMAMGPFMEITCAIGMLFLGYLLWACLRYYRAGNKSKARILLWSISLFVLGVASDMAVAGGLYKFVYMTEYGYFAMVLLIDHSLTREMLEAARLRRGRLADEGRYKRMFQHVPGVYFELSPEGRILDVSPSAYQMAGLAPETVVGRYVDDFYVYPEQREELRRRMQQTGRVDEFDVHLRFGEGNEGDFAVAALIVSGDSGAPPRVVGSLRNITKRKQAETAAARAAELHKRLLTVATAMDDAPTLAAGLNVALETGLELSGSEAGAVYVLEKGVPVLQARQNLSYGVAKALEKLPVDEEDMQTVLLRGRPVSLGSLPWDSLGMREVRGYETAHVAPCTAGDELVGFFLLSSANALGNSVTSEGIGELASETAAFIARRRFVELAQRREEQYRRTQQFAHVGSWEYDVLEKSLRGSRETGRIFGFDTNIEDITLGMLMEVIHPGDSERIQGALSSFVEGTADAYDVEYRIIRHNDGEVRTVHSVAQVVDDEAGRKVKLLGTVQDITDRKQLQQQLLLAQRMESVGLLAGGIAHDFNNLLSVILSYSDLVLSGMDSSEPKYGMIHEIGQAADRARHLTQQLLAFSRRQVMEMRVIDLNAVLREMAPMFKRLIGEGIELRVEPHETELAVEADPAQIQQIMMNLVVNGRDAMPDGGVLTIETQQDSVDGPVTDQTGATVVSGTYCVISVTDTGCGMTQEVLERVFDPFFTTKAPGEGTGLGLATVYGIVKQHGGYIQAVSTPGEGSCFRVYLRSVEKEIEQLPGYASPQDSAGGSETILVVEDEEMVRDLTSNVLRRHGYEVLTAEDGQAALELANTCNRQIDLLLTDVVMPRMNGRELYEHLSTREPRIKVLFMSGYSNDLVSDCSNLGPETVLLHKPFTVQMLTERVRTILDA